jgi:type II secretory pathway pseudopilin PulG
MPRSSNFRNRKISKLRNSERGYLLITLMLAMALVTIGLLAVLPEISQQIRRDREDEMRHRGTAYMRAIQHFYKKFGRYPSRVEELENTNNLRFLRKRYTDPMSVDPVTGKEKDFKFLHQTDISLNNGPVLGQMPGQGGLPGPGGIPGQAGLPGQQGAFGGAQAQAGLAALQGGLAAMSQPGGVQQTNNPFAQNASGGDADNPDGGGNSGTPGSPSSPGSGPGANSNTGSGSSSGFNGPTFGGGPILGVASTNKKDKSIRVFYDKSHYNDWLFIYLPQADRGGLLTGPVNPGMPNGNLNGGLPGQPGGGLPGQALGQGFGQGFGQGQGQGFGQNQGLSPNSGPQSSPTQPQSPSGQQPPE